jgi:hypothetical protein
MNPAQGPKIVEDLAIVDPRVFAMANAVQDFEIVKEQVRQGRNGQQVGAGGLAAGIDGGVKALAPATFQQVHEEEVLSQRLTSRKGNPSAGLVEKNSVLENLV